MELVILQETKLTGGVYTRRSAGYIVTATDVSSQHRSRITVFYWPLPRYVLGGIHQFNTNTVGFQLETGDQQWYIIRCYLAPDNTLTKESVVTTLNECPWVSNLLVAGE